MSENKKFLQDSFITLVRQVTSIIIGLLLVVILARTLGPELQGFYTTITLFALILNMIFNFGINISTVYYVSKKEIQIEQAFYNNLLVGIVLGVFGIVGGGGYLLLFGSSTFPDIPLPLLYMILLTVPFIIINSFFQTIFQGIQNFKIFNTVLIVTQFSNLFMVVVLVVFLNLSITGALLAFFLGHFLTTLYILYVLFFKYKIKITRKSSVDRVYLKKSFTYGFKSYLSNLFTFLNYRLDIILVGFFVNPFAVGIYATAVNVSEKLSVFTQSISTVLLPKISSLGEEVDRNKLTSIVSRFMLFFMILLGVALFVLSDWVIQLMFSDRYLGSSLLLKIMLPGIALLAVEKILSNDIAARGRPEINMYVSIANVIFSVTLNLILIPKYGAVGAAVTTSITYGLSFFVKCVLFSKITGMAIPSFLLIHKKDLTLLVNLLKKYTRTRLRGR